MDGLFSLSFFLLLGWVGGFVGFAGWTGTDWDEMGKRTATERNAWVYISFSAHAWEAFYVLRFTFLSLECST